ncbi:MAG: AraC family transcriptional regulator [Bacteroidales bacterium]|nr:AraC family transcriptional regulator [Bacteroidales bacterium]
MKLYIKYMVSSRCKTAVKEALRNLGLHYVFVDLGEVDIMEDISTEQSEQLKMDLRESGLELMDDKRGVLIEKIKTIVMEMVYHSDGNLKINLPDYLHEKLDRDYTSMAALFSEVQGITIGQFLIFHKIERIKELMIYSEINMTELAWKMNYSSVAHLSNQFKKVTGLTPSHFRQLGKMRQCSIDESEKLNATKI